MRIWIIGPAAALAFTLAGCAGMTDREVAGTAGGAAVGGAIGHTVGGSVGAAAGAGGGALLGHEAARRYEERRK
ncbi:MAG TPA: glycine zipper domain-containing protein [Burkholderiales bacterium]|nr:glycine zipper domain-containing protein [Burkholderiales bacterium]